MPIVPTGRLDLHAVFCGVQKKMLAELEVGRMFEHHPTAGAVGEQHWLELLDSYLPKRYRATPGFVINAKGGISQQIDIVIYDQLHAPVLHPVAAAVHVPVESVCAVFEVKTQLSKDLFGHAAEKAASVRALTRRRILAGILGTSTVWKDDGLRDNLKRTLRHFKGREAINIGCALDHGAFDTRPRLEVCGEDESLIFFTLHLIERLAEIRPVKQIALLEYLKKSKR